MFRYFVYAVFILWLVTSLGWLIFEYRYTDNPDLSPRLRWELAFRTSPRIIRLGLVIIQLMVVILGLCLIYLIMQLTLGDIIFSLGLTR